MFPGGFGGTGGYFDGGGDLDGGEGDLDGGEGDLDGGEGDLDGGEKDLDGDDGEGHFDGGEGKLDGIEGDEVGFVWFFLAFFVVSVDHLPAFRLFFPLFSAQGISKEGRRKTMHNYQREPSSFALVGWN